MEKFNFLIGDWILKYTVPKSRFSEEATGEGKGKFAKKLNNKYVYFDYAAKFTTGSAQAHAIFAKDKKHYIYRFWWFEDSGSYQTATCQFLDKNTLFLNLHDTLLIQTFSKVRKDYILLHMSYPKNKDEFNLILQVEFFRKS